MSRHQTLTERFAMNLRTMRADRHQSQADLAKKAKLSVSYVSMLERGQRAPPLVTVESIAKALGVAPERLLVATGARTASGH